VLEALIVSNVLLWLLVFGLLVTVLALARQVGVLHERVAPMGALMMDAGPAVGDSVPALALADLDGAPLRLGAGRPALLFFLSPECPVCKKLLPILRSLHDVERGAFDLVFASDGAEHDHRAFRAASGLGEHPYLLSTELGMAFRVSKLPYAVLVDAAGKVKAKGLVNSREQVESLFTAGELGVASIQDYLARAQAAAAASSGGAAPPAR